jgi:hypothetical protein
MDVDFLRVLTPFFTLGLISEREKELAKELNFDQAKPYYGDDEPPNAKVISFVKPS